MWFATYFKGLPIILMEQEIRVYKCLQTLILGKKILQTKQTRKKANPKPQDQLKSQSTVFTLQDRWRS